jgi:hypothetical protein
MRLFVAILAVLALVGSAMAWDINEELQYTLKKNGFQQGPTGDSSVVLNQVIGTTSGAYFKEPNLQFGDGWGQVDNTLVGATIDRTNNFNGAPVGANPYVGAANNNFYTTLTQGGSASLAVSCKDTIDTAPEIVGDASAYQNLWVGGEFAKTTANFDSRAIIGFSDIATNDYTIVNPHHFVATDVASATAGVDAEAHGAGLFNTANMGVQVDADLEQNYVGTGWASPTYSGGITMWANFDGACDPFCSNPIETTVNGKAETSIFPANQAMLNINDGPNSYGIGDSYYWGNQFSTNPQAQAVVGGSPNDAW